MDRLPTEVLVKSLTSSREASPTPNAMGRRWPDQAPRAWRWSPPRQDRPGLHHLHLRLEARSIELQLINPIRASRALATSKRAREEQEKSERAREERKSKRRAKEQEKSERAKERKSERAKEPKRQRARERKGERVKERKNERAKERKSKRAKERNWRRNEVKVSSWRVATSERKKDTGMRQDDSIA